MEESSSRRNLIGAFIAGIAGAGPRTTQSSTSAGPRSVVQIDVTTLGAVGDGVSDDSDAIRRALLRALELGQKVPAVIFFPPGEYLVTQSHAFNVPNQGYCQNLRVTGSGWGQSRIRFRPATDGDHWLYDGGSPSAESGFQILWAYFEHLAFIADDSRIARGSINLFRHLPRRGNPNQNWEFYRCLFEGPSKLAGIVMRVDGMLCGSENRFVLCRARWWSSFLYLNNPQAVNHDFISCDLELFHGPIFRVRSGSQINVIGGSYILSGSGGYPEVRESDPDRMRPCLFDFESQSEGLTGVVTVLGIRTELRGDWSSLVLARGINNRILVVFLGCSFDTVTGRARAISELRDDSGIRVAFQHCSLGAHVPVGFRFLRAPGAPSAECPLIEVDGCTIREDLSRLTQWTDQSNGTLQLRNCKTTGRRSRIVKYAEFSRGPLESSSGRIALSSNPTLGQVQFPQFENAGANHQFRSAVLSRLPECDVLLSVDFHAAAEVAGLRRRYELLVGERSIGLSTTSQDGAEAISVFRTFIARSSRQRTVQIRYEIEAGSPVTCEYSHFALLEWN